MNIYMLALLRALTDPGVFFNIGNVPISFAQSRYAAYINVAIATFAFFIRLVVELRADALKYNLRGLALMASGIFTLIAAAFAFSAALGNSSITSSLLPSGMLACFGIVHAFRGLATCLRDGISKFTLDSIAFVAAVVGYLFAFPELPIFLKLSYCFIAILAISLAVKSKAPSGCKQPDILFAITSFTAAFLAPSLSVSWGFLMWGLGYISVTAMRMQYRRPK